MNNTTKTPHELLTKQLVSSVKLNSKVRQLLQRRLESINREMNSPNIPDARWARLSSELVSILESNSAIIAKTAGLLVPQKTKPTPEPSSTHQDVLEELI